MTACQMWRAYLADAEARRDPHARARIRLAIRHGLDLSPHVSWAAVRWALCLERRHPETLCAAYIEAAVALATRKP